MNIESMMQGINDRISASASAKLMSLGQFIGALEECDQSKSVRMDFSYDGPGKFESYRGYYEQLALIGFTDNATVVSVLEDAKSALGKEFYGYKGGEYVMHEDTPIWWAASHSQCHDTGVVRISEEGYCVVIHTAFVEL